MEQWTPPKMTKKIHWGSTSLSCNSAAINGHIVPSGEVISVGESGYEFQLNGPE